MDYYVYLFRLEGSELPFYIGKGRGDRKTAHFWPSRLKKNSHKNNIIRKAMADGVAILTEILFDGLTEEQAHAKEIELIAFYGRHINGGCLSNATDGGEGSSCHSPSPETRLKLSIANRGRKHSEETKLMMSKMKRGMYKGRKHSEETRARMSDSKKKMTALTRKRMSDSRTGAKNHASIGTYVTPWGEFESLKAAVNKAPSPISEPTLSNYCRKYNDKVFVGRATKQFLNGRTPRECGFSFVPKEEHGL